MRTRPMIQRNSQSKAAQASRNSNQPPAKLAKLIALTNLVPPKTELGNLHEKFVELLESIGLDRWTPQWAKKLRALVHSYLEGLPGSFQSYVLGTTWPDDNDAGILIYGVASIERYTLIKDARLLLRGIRTVSESGYAFYRSTLEVKTKLRLDEQGVFVLQRNQLIEALEGVEAERIRTCPICEQIFWAGRINQPACSKRCSHALRNRKYRERYLTDYKMQRIGLAPKTDRGRVRTSRKRPPKA